MSASAVLPGTRRGVAAEPADMLRGERLAFISDSESSLVILADCHGGAPGCGALTVGLRVGVCRRSCARRLRDREGWVPPRSPMSRSRVRSR